MRKKWYKFLGSLMAVTIACSSVPLTVTAKEAEFDENIIVSTSVTGGKLRDLVSGHVGDAKAKVVEEYDSGMALVNVKGKGKLESVLSELQSAPAIEFAQKDYVVTCEEETRFMEPKDSFFVYQWGLHNFGQLIGDYGVKGEDVNVLPAWNITQGSEDVLVGVLDSGIDITHEDLQNSIFVNRKEIPGNGVDDDHNGYIDDITGWDFLHNDNTVYDDPNEDFHGTYVAGIIAADKNETGISGVAPNVKIMPLKFISTTDGSTSNAIKAIEYASKMGVDIMNCSWGGTEYNKALKKAMKKSKMLFVCSSGNEAACTDETPYYPTCFNINNIISVGAMDNQGTWARFGNYGEDVDVVAPGVNVIGTAPGNGYLFGSGTSFAAPYVTGVAALVKSVKPDSTYKVMKKAIVQNVVVEEQFKDKVNTSGRVDAYHTIQYVLDKYKIKASTR